MESSSITSWQIEGEKVEVVTDFLFLGSKITADVDCIHEIWWFLLGRKAMTNLNSMLKSRGITLLTKVCIVKAMVFPVGHVQLWELDQKQGRIPKNWCLWTVVLKTSESPLDSKEIKPVNLKGDQFTEGLMMNLKLQYFGHLMWIDDSLEKSLMLGKIEDRRRRGPQRMRKLDDITYAMNMNLGKLWEMVRDREA